MSKEWFYVEDNGYKGPVSEEEIRKLYAESKLTENSLVWGGYGDKWIPLKYYGLNKDEDGEEIIIGEEKHSESVKNGILWGFHFSVFLLSILIVLTPDGKAGDIAVGAVLLIYAAINLLVVKKDKRALKKAGFYSGGFKAAVVFPPIYIWKRNKVLGRSKIRPIALWFLCPLIGFCFTIMVCYETMFDPRDEKTYLVVTIGNQTWMAENLNYENQGYCYDLSGEFCEENGRRYTWSEAISACPEGWHLPSQAEFETLIESVGGPRYAGKMLKSKEKWDINTNGEDKFGFNALPSGFSIEDMECGEDGSTCPEDAFNGSYAYFWTSTKTNSQGIIFALSFDSDIASFIASDGYRETYASVRCIQDN